MPHMQHLNELEEVDESQYQPAQSSVNLPKNRHQNIMPCEYLWVWHGTCGCGQVQVTNILYLCFIDDRYRVRLLLHPGVYGSDYINASYVDVSYHCTQTYSHMMVT